MPDDGKQCRCLNPANISQIVMCVYLHFLGFAFIRIPYRLSVSVLSLKTCCAK